MRAPRLRLWRSLARSPALALLLALIAACLVGPAVAAGFGLDATTMRVDQIALPPSSSHWLGTDAQGRDLLVRVLLGGRVALATAAAATALAVLLGALVGAGSALAGGAVDAVLMRAVDALYAVPTAALVLVTMAVLDSRSLALLVALLAATSWMSLARVVRAHTRGLLARDFITAARALGASPARVLWRHLLPNSAGLLAVYAAAALPQLLVAEAFLSFLGLGVQAPRASLGTLVVEGSAQLLVAPWILVGPALLLAALILALLSLGDRVRDAVDSQDRSARR